MSQHHNCEEKLCRMYVNYCALMSQVTAPGHNFTGRMYVKLCHVLCTCWVLMTILSYYSLA